jgi:hypothetical protein
MSTSTRLSKIEAFLHSTRTKQIMADDDISSIRQQHIKMVQNCSYELADEENEYELNRPGTELGKMIQKLDMAIQQASDKKQAILID